MVAADCPACGDRVPVDHHGFFRSHGRDGVFCTQSGELCPVQAEVKGRQSRERRWSRPGTGPMALRDRPLLRRPGRA